MKVYEVLFLCTGNSARSILAEAILRERGGGRFRAWSAGSHPTGRVHPLALELLSARGHDTHALRSKSWNELAPPAGPDLDIVITVCDAAAGEACPLWAGQPVTVHWGLEDPAACAGPPDRQRASFRRVYVELERRIEHLVRLPLAALDRRALQARLAALARPEPESEAREGER